MDVLRLMMMIMNICTPSHKVLPPVFLYVVMIMLPKEILMNSSMDYTKVPESNGHLKEEILINSPMDCSKVRETNGHV